MADSLLQVFSATGGTAAIDIRTEATNGDGRQVVILGDPLLNANVAAVASQDVPTASSDKTTPGIVMRGAGSFTVVGLDGTTARPFRMNSDGAIKVYEVANGTMTINGTVTGITNSIAVHVLSTGGTLIVKPDPAGTFFTNNASTVNIFTVSGSTSGVSLSGVQLVAPSANASFKVFAFSLQTTGIVSVVARFTNGGGSATEFWRALVTSNQTSSTPIGANLAVQPPGYLFATGTSTTLALHLDTATLVHYSVSYIKESA